MVQSFIRFAVWPALAVLCASCTSKILSADKSEELLRHDEYDSQLKVTEMNSGTPSVVNAAGSANAPSAGSAQPPASNGDKQKYVKWSNSIVAPKPVPLESLSKSQTASQSRASSKAQRNKSKRKKHDRNDSESASRIESASQSGETAVAPVSIDASAHLPSLEDGEGFEGRRPIKDPFRVGEKVTLEASYFSVVAGDVTIEVRPFVEVNGQKSYNFAGTAKSTSVFAMFYAVDDWFETLVDFNTFVPYSYSLHVKESKQLRETRTIFDNVKGHAVFWDKKINAEKKLEEQKKEWDIPPFSQNVFTAVFYLRTFNLVPGKKVSFRLGHEKENLIVSAEVLRRETISTPAGDFNTLVIKPNIALNGEFKPVGDNFLWLTDDDRKFLVRIESKIKIGKLVGVVKELDKGQP